jgi:adenylate cyclase
MHREHIVVYGGYDPGVACSLWLSWTLTLQGWVDEATALTHDGLALAKRHGHAFSLAWVHQAVSVSRQLLGDWGASAASAAEAVRLADEHGFPHVLGMATINRGWALVMQGDAAGGIPLVRDGVAMVDETGAGLVRPSYLAMLGGTSLIEGDLPACLARIDEGLAEIERSGERIFQAWLLVEKGRLLAVGDAQDAAEACMRRAVDIARGQGARMPELRAATALARWCHEHGRTDEGRAELARAFAWFAEHPTEAPDVVAARVLTDELAAS